MPALLHLVSTWLQRRQDSLSGSGSTRDENEARRDPRVVQASEQRRLCPRTWSRRSTTTSDPPSLSLAPLIPASSLSPASTLPFASSPASSTTASSASTSASTSFRRTNPFDRDFGTLGTPVEVEAEAEPARRAVVVLKQNGTGWVVEEWVSDDPAQSAGGHSSFPFPFASSSPPAYRAVVRAPGNQHRDRDHDHNQYPFQSQYRYQDRISPHDGRAADAHGEPCHDSIRQDHGRSRSYTHTSTDAVSYLSVPDIYPSTGTDDFMSGFEAELDTAFGREVDLSLWGCMPRCVCARCSCAFSI